MARLTVSLLGPPEMALDGLPVSGLNSDKVRALLFYLAVEHGYPKGHLRRAHRREFLAGLLWPDYPERSARTNLSNALSNLRAALGDREATTPFFRVSHEAIQFNAQSDAWVDVTAFEGHVARGEWKEAIDLYRDPFLEGFSLSDSPPFEQWALVGRERLVRQMMAALEGLAAKSEAQGDYPRAAETARRQLEIEPWHEGAHRALMRALALSGQRASALAQYEACVKALEEELDAEPSPETAALYEQIRDGRDLTGLGNLSGLRALPPRHNLPAQVTSFVGRERELGELGALLADPDVRLVTVVGPGGMGKTRLALEAARAGFSAGAWLVELAPVSDPGEVTLAVASALGAQPQPGRELTDVIVDSLQTRELLLVIDNCEHLLASVAWLVSHLISRCPQLTVLATGREALRISGEHIVEVLPMDVLPPGTDSILAQADVAGALGSDAVRLFAARAAAVRPGFAVDEGNAADVVQICRWPSSWQPPAGGRCRSRTSRPAWATASPC
jgi:DNA-binding SARP family transcriptional activator